MQNNNKYFIYCRKSSESEDRQIQSIESQVTRLEELAKIKGYDVIKKYTESKSAKVPNNRPQFKEMIERIKKGDATGILCWHLNRLSRNPEEAGLIMGMLERGQIKCIRTTERDYLPIDNVLLMSVEFGMANQYSRDLSKVVKRGVEDKLKKGQVPWMSPVGYLNDRNSHSSIKDPERFLVIRKVWDYMLTGSYSVKKVWRMLNNDWGFRTLKRKKVGGTPLALSHMYSILTNPFYAGIIRCKGEEYQGTHEPMITLEEFDHVQKLLKKRGKPRSKTKELPYRGFIKCGECGCMITGDIKEKLIRSTGLVKKYTYYCCTGKKVNYQCSQRKAISQDQMEIMIAEALDEITIVDHAREKALDALSKETDKDMATSVQVYETQHRTLEQIQSQLFELTQMRTRNMIDDEEYLKNKLDLKKEMGNLQLAVKTTEVRADKLIELTEKTFDFATYALIKWKNGDTQTKKDLVMALGQNFTLKDGKLTLEMHEWFVPIKEKKETGEIQKNTSEPTLTQKKPSDSSESFFWLGSWDSNPGPTGYTLS